MSKERLLADILNLPVEERRGLIGEAIDSLPGTVAETDMTPEWSAELDQRCQDALDHPEDEVSWEEACRELDRRKSEQK